MDLSAINPRLDHLREAQLTAAVVVLEAGIAAGVIKNVDFKDAKDTINRAVDEAYNHYQDETGDYDGRLIMGAYDVPHGIKQADMSRGERETDEDRVSDRRAVLQVLLPLHELLQAAKPFVVKRQTGPGAPKTALQLEREAATMTCQCCGRKYLANLGTIAHHGYERPGGGWQTASCAGAKRSPFEVSRDFLGIMISDLKTFEARAVLDRKAVSDETRPVTIRLLDRSAGFDYRGRRPMVSLDVTRQTFEAESAAREDDFRRNGILSFAVEKADDIRRRDREINGVRAEIAAQQARYDGWKQTHRWDGDGWVQVGIGEAA